MANIFTVGTDPPVVAGSVGPLENALVTGDMPGEMDIDQAHPCHVVTDVIFSHRGLPGLQNKPKASITTIHHTHCRPVIIPVKTVLKK